MDVVIYFLSTKQVAVMVMEIFSMHLNEESRVKSQERSIYRLAARPVENADRKMPPGSYLQVHERRVDSTTRLHVGKVPRMTQSVGD